MPYHTHPMRRTLEFLAATQYVCFTEFRDLRQIMCAAALYQSLPSNRDLGAAILRGKKEAVVSPFGIVEFEPRSRKGVPYDELTKTYYSIVCLQRFTSCDYETTLPDCVKELNAKQQWIIFSYRRPAVCDKYFALLR